MQVSREREAHRSVACRLVACWYSSKYVKQDACRSAVVQVPPSKNPKYTASCSGAERVQVGRTPSRLKWTVVGEDGGFEVE